MEPQIVAIHFTRFTGGGVQEPSRISAQKKDSRDKFMNDLEEQLGPASAAFSKPTEW
jgi:hypothetical protein